MHQQSIQILGRKSEVLKSSIEKEKTDYREHD